MIVIITIYTVFIFHNFKRRGRYCDKLHLSRGYPRYWRLLDCVTVVGHGELPDCHKEELPLLTFVIMGIMALISMAMTYFWPETRNKIMAETMHERKVVASDLGVEGDLDPQNRNNLGDLQLGMDSDSRKNEKDVAFPNKAASNPSTVTA
ncbi:hypothetical protein ElyMa_006525300 [Elysia marginata]|uniref:Uncharacterized protein n=1 Tax=Elysia marginata TaxID=1093978 RepID=A0AAV4I597_9GAST|nr:hypothetical protein ElyMa_006525300 [Elysia marginata]